MIRFNHLLFGLTTFYILSLNTVNSLFKNAFLGFGLRDLERLESSKLSEVYFIFLKYYLLIYFTKVISTPNVGSNSWLIKSCSSHWVSQVPSQLTCDIFISSSFFSIWHFSPPPPLLFPSLQSLLCHWNSVNVQPQRPKKLVLDF